MTPHCSRLDRSPSLIDTTSMPLTLGTAASSRPLSLAAWLQQSRHKRAAREGRPGPQLFGVWERVAAVWIPLWIGMGSRSRFSMPGQCAANGPGSRSVAFVFAFAVSSVTPCRESHLTLVDPPLPRVHRYRRASKHLQHHHLALSVMHGSSAAARV